VHTPICKFSACHILPLCIYVACPKVLEDNRSVTCAGCGASLSTYGDLTQRAERPSIFESPLSGVRLLTTSTSGASFLLKPYTWLTDPLARRLPLSWPFNYCPPTGGGLCASVGKHMKFRDLAVVYIVAVGLSACGQAPEV
jgi:hypothetical protein